MHEKFDEPSAQDGPQQEHVESPSNEELEKQEGVLKEEIAEGITELSKTIEDIESLTENEKLTPPLRERLLTAIDTIGAKVQTKFLKHLGGSAIVGGIFALQEYLINTENSIVEVGSILHDANELALAAIGVYASIKGLKFTGYKIREFAVKKGIHKGTIAGGSRAGAFITREGDDADTTDEFEHLGISYAERAALYEESYRIFEEEGWHKNYNWPEFEKALRRVQTESSRMLAQK